MTKKKTLKAELLVDRGAVNKQMVMDVLSGGAILSYAQMLAKFGVVPRSVPEEFAHMDEVRRRARALERVTYDRGTSIRLRLIDILDDETRTGKLSRAFGRQGEKIVPHYFLPSSREALLASGLIRQDSKEIFILDASPDLEERAEMLTHTRGSKVERLG